MREACLLGASLLSLLRAQKVGRERLKGRRAPLMNLDRGLSAQVAHRLSITNSNAAKHSSHSTVPIFVREVVERRRLTRDERVSLSMKRWDSKTGQFERTRTIQGRLVILRGKQMMELIEKNGAPGGTRTPDLLVRSQTLYPTELRARGLEILT